MNKLQALEFVPILADYLIEATDKGELDWDGDAQTFRAGPWAMTVISGTDEVVVTYYDSYAFWGNDPRLVGLLNNVSTTVGLRTLQRIKETYFPELPQGESK